MNSTCLEYLLTDFEKKQFEEQGYLIVSPALSENHVQELLEVVDRVDVRERNKEVPEQLLSVTDIIGEDDKLVDLVDLPSTFPKVWGILGWNIYLYHSHLDITPPGNEEVQPVAWHQDSLRVNEEIEGHPRPRLSLKIGYYLTDVSEPDRGNTLILPGSHLLDELDCPQDGISSPAGAIPLCLKPGDALILDRRTWHSRSANRSDITRKVLWLGYSYRWMMPKDKMTVEHLYESLDPIRRQLLGARVSMNGVYDPTEGDVPLRSWLAEHSPENAVWTRHKRPQARPPAHENRVQLTGRKLSP
ncbi:MAG: phytanoyl-CoA dioxygenase family protein [Planctomycetota bacterium]|nr:phytanoyl-CoA dioxygenase family protein [Planctomycetota bacterium]MDA1140281.1 phytanoyl-CoA dioxygenase family protein [Planctomycetota bacterium]